AYQPQNSRSQFQRTDKNQLILDAYNANPSSMKLALESLDDIAHPNKLAILGEMKEGGENSAQEHKAMLDFCQEKKIPCITVGQLFEDHNTEMRMAHFNSTPELVEYLKSNTQKDRLILVKASRSVGLEKIVPLL
ncbi:MAG: glutamate ligase domain-containing protein, partial [Luteibaculum sp.]